MDKKTIVSFVIIAIVAFSAGFFVRKYSAGTTLADLKNLSAEERRTALSDSGAMGGVAAGGTRTGGNRAGRGGFGGGAPGESFVSGEVLSVDAKSITVKSADGSSKIVYISDETKVSKSVTGTIPDVKSQTFVTVTGNADAAGVLTAKTIQLRDNVPEKK
jgi:hypothetical protein